MGKNTWLCCLLLWGAAIGQEEVPGVTEEVPAEEVASEDVAGEDEDLVTVKTYLGVVKGMKAETEKGTTYFKFKGIPYAQPPVGSLRFQPPRPSSAWGTLVATEDGPACPQISTLTSLGYQGEEDCLYLNIYTPSLTTTTNPFALKSVMLWIHGGGFTEGSGREIEYDPVNFIDKDVVVVSINYRLGPLGFVTFGNDKVSGNMALKDQNMAIRWTRNYIRYFGGDPEKITIFGESAGGMSVHAQVLSPYNQGLLAGAISQSGTALMRPYATGRSQDERSAVKLAEMFDCSSNRLDEEMLECLQQVPAKDLIEAVTVDPEDWLNPDKPNFSWSPVVDSYSPNPFLPIYPLEALKTGVYNQVPFMSGTTKDEGSLFTLMFWDRLEFLQENWEFAGPAMLSIMKTNNASDIDNETSMVANIMKKYYTGDDISQDNKDALTAMFGDGLFLSRDQKAVSLMSEGTSPVFNYQFTYRGSNTFASLFGKADAEEDFGVVHGNDLMYLFKSPIIASIGNLGPPTEDDMKMVDLMVTYWTNFAKYGNPTPFKMAGVENWTPVRPDQKNYLDLQLEPTMKQNLEEERMFFWERMFWEPMEDDIERQALIKKAMKFFMRNYRKHKNTHQVYY